MRFKSGFHEHLQRRLSQHRPHTIDGDNVRRAAVALIVRATPNTDDELMLILRATHPDDPWSGQMGLPGGHVDDSDSDPQAAVLREVREEVGINLRRQGKLVGTLDDVMTTAGGRTSPVIVTPFVFALHKPVCARPNSEVQCVFWFRAATLRDPAIASTVEHRDASDVASFPCLRIDGQTIWGLTLRILEGLWSVAEEAPATKPQC